MKKIIITLLIVITFFIILGDNVVSEKREIKNDKKIAKVYIPDGTPAIGMAKMVSSKESIKDFLMKYEIEGTPDTLVAEVMKENPDISIVPSNLAAQAYNKGLDYEIIGTVGFGSLYLISTEGEAKLEDLKGKEVFGIGKGLTPDLVFKTILKEKNLIDKINLSYVGGGTEILPAVLSGKAKYAVVPEPALSTLMSKNKNIKIILNLNKEWEKIFGVKEGFPQSTIIAKKSLIENNKEFIDLFLEKIEKSILFSNENKDEVVELFINNGGKINKDITSKSIENSNLKFKKAKETKEEYIKYYEILEKENSKSIGGKVPDEKIFYEG